MRTFCIRISKRTTNQAKPSFLRSIIKREQNKQKNRSKFKKAIWSQRVRRQKLGKERRERDLIKLKVGHSYQSSSFGSETFSKLTRKGPADQGLEQDD